MLVCGITPLEDFPPRLEGFPRGLQRRSRMPGTSPLSERPDAAYKHQGQQVPAAAGKQASADERNDLADESLQRLDVVWGRLLRDHRPETEVDVGPQPIGELLGCAVPERVVVGDFSHRRPVVLHRSLPDAVGLRLAVADGELDAEGELDLRDVPSDRVAVPSEDLDLVSHLLDRAHRVPHICITGDGPKGLLLAAAADQDREVRLDGRGSVAQVVELVPAAWLRRDGLAVEDAPDRADRLVEPIQPLTEP